MNVAFDTNQDVSDVSGGDDVIEGYDTSTMNGPSNDISGAHDSGGGIGVVQWCNMCGLFVRRFRKTRVHCFTLLSKGKSYQDVQNAMRVENSVIRGV